MKIVTFSTLYPNAARPQHALFVESRLRELVASGHAEAKVVAPVPWFPWRHPLFGEYAQQAQAPHAETRAGIEVLHPRYPVFPKVGMTLAPYFMYRAVLPMAKRLLERYPFELIDAHYFYPDGVAAVMLARALNRPVVITGRGTDLNLIAQHALPQRMIRWAARHAAALITVSQALKTRLEALGVGADRIHVLRNGVDLERFRPVDRPSVRQRLGLQRRTLLSVGNLLLFKGHDLAIRALSSLPDCELIVIGAGPDRAALEALAKASKASSRIRFAGALPQDELRDYYGAADALILASSREGWPNVLLESMACGTPVIASAVGGVPEIVTSAEAGALFSERSAEAVAAAVHRLFAHYPDRGATRRHAERFSWAATTRGQLELFSRILAARTVPAGIDAVAAP